MHTIEVYDVKMNFICSQVECAIVLEYNILYLRRNKLSWRVSMFLQIN